jgi:hypothetical protein
MTTTNTTDRVRIGSDTYTVTVSDSGYVTVTGYEGRLCGQVTDDGVVWSRATRGRYSEQMRQCLGGHVMAARAARVDADAECGIEPRMLGYDEDGERIVQHDGSSEYSVCTCGRTVDAAVEDMGDYWNGTCPDCGAMMGMFAR